MELSDFDVLTFDCYGTLIDWESGILQALKPWLNQHKIELTDATILEMYARHESKIEHDFPGIVYTDILYRVHKALAKEWNIIHSTDDEATRFSLSVKDWPTFSDSHDALKTLKRYYKLAILSNIDNQSIQHSINKLGVEFDYVFSAQDIGSYKPNQRNFQYLLDNLATCDIQASKVLHTAQSLFHDHVPAKAIGMATCWINRRYNKSGWGATPEPSHPVKPDFQFNSLADMAAARQQLN
ncbi:uncharacterized protein TRIADDRAFT_21266 [Trichoplax adhaerens]|uniref:Haloacid dehalogenase n=1 Tax=Trichoplax adhaerens TaxID=10228 RepID=B3RME2_TRIAD|nr:hypothetical protein TRIADDRAFT_21266 [Trichoplax adhaerens]EDV27833.1 hypothetical protein TRIADDRAFT_21266 [Trichoplax adhaerens]|eukprot:XP_002109667.1 hypothetical protein TRIADDRAFT_21266 [Trichoplax adhaerens]